MSFTYPYPRPAVTADVVLFAVRDGLELLLIQRRSPPYEGRWALPGGFLDLDEELETAAGRELEEETGLRVRALEQLGAYGKVGRDPRGRTVSVAYLAFQWGAPPEADAGDDAREARWFPARRLPPLAFDHRQIVRDARRRLECLVETDREILRLAPRRFSLSEVRATYEAILGREVAAASLRRGLLRRGIVEECGGNGRGGKLYKLRKTA